MVSVNSSRRLPFGSSVTERSAPLEIASKSGLDLESDREDGLAVRLVPARKRPPGICRFELGRGDDVLDAVLVAERAPVKAPELVVQHAGEIALEEAETWPNIACSGEGDPLEVLVERDGESDRLE